MATPTLQVTTRSTSVIDLDTMLDNENRKFDASEFRFDHATFQAWKDDQSWAVLNASPREDCKNVRLVGDTLVVAFCRVRYDDGVGGVGEYCKRFIRLDYFLGNNNGHFDTAGEKFHHSARNVRIEGTHLVAELCTIGGEWRRDSLCLSQLVCCAGGSLRPVTTKGTSPQLQHYGHRTALEEKIDAERATSAILYAPLDHTKKLFRLCYIMPGEWHEQVQCHMTTASMGEGEVPSYRCLSYCWGFESAGETISINGHSVPVQQNLVIALRRLRARGMHSPLWIDALCINQQDNEEKSIQVAQMATIYSCAAEVFVWIGDDCTAPSKDKGQTDLDFSWSTLLTNAIECLAREPVGPPHLWDFQSFTVDASGNVAYGNGHAVQLADAIDWFLSSDWFTRSWTLQELTLSENATVIFGSSAIPWQTTLLKGLNVLSSHLSECCAFFARPDPEGNTVNRRLVPQLRRLVEHMWQLRGIRNLSELARGDKNISAAYRRDCALLVLHKCRPQKASDARDKLFAFYSMANASFATVRPDYTKNVGEIYTAFTFGIIMQMSSFDVWALGNPKRDEETTSSDVPNLPSWVLDWSSAPAGDELTNLLRYRFRDTKPPSWSPPLEPPQVARLASPGVLDVDGCEFDQIEELSDSVYASFPTWSQSKWDRVSWEAHGLVLQEWTRFLRLEHDHDQGQTQTKHGDLWESLWKTLVGKDLQVNVEGKHIGLIFHGEDPFAVMRNRTLFDTWWAKHRQPWTGGYEDRELSRVTDRINFRAKDRRLFRSRDGSLGLAPAWARAGDGLFTVRGSRWPVVLRPGSTVRETTALQGIHKLVGPCVVHRVAFGGDNDGDDRVAPIYIS
ncbi:Uu.00g134270.m01.CDS01 [Anthostomella pinea]|uniref:Uu.00g134270.m01.CDS01 n=1 Tax=Anthostomella pinea TaxID=933095 RepID=A0AAI8YKP3_9PEZI|nr:Uu.00g134270.m01.CDS01 [Anthostomella pinea]